MKVLSRPFRVQPLDPACLIILSHDLILLDSHWLRQMFLRASQGWYMSYDHRRRSPSTCLHDHNFVRGAIISHLRYMKWRNIWARKGNPQASTIKSSRKRPNNISYSTYTLRIAIKVLSFFLFLKKLDSHSLGQSHSDNSLSFKLYYESA